MRGKSLTTTTSIKDLPGNIVRDEKEILSRWRECFEDLLNPAPTDQCSTIDFRKEKVFTFTKVAAAIGGLKSGKTAGKDKIQPKM